MNVSNWKPHGESTHLVGWQADVRDRRHPIGRMGSPRIERGGPGTRRRGADGEGEEGRAVTASRIVVPLSLQLRV